MVMLLTGEFLYQDRPGRTRPAYLEVLKGGDIARLNLIAGVVTPRWLMLAAGVLVCRA